jgi:hypothetical protein
MKILAIDPSEKRSRAGLNTTLLFRGFVVTLSGLERDQVLRQADASECCVVDHF